MVSWKTPVRTRPNIQRGIAEQIQVRKPGKWRIWLRCPTCGAGDPTKGARQPKFSKRGDFSPQ